MYIRNDNNAFCSMKITQRITPRSEQVLRLFKTIPRRSITNEEEFALGFEYQQATPQRRAEIEDILVKNNLGFAVSLAKQYIGTIEFEDLIIVAAMGLLEGIRTWDPSRGIKLISWAVNHMRKWILNEVSMHMRTVRVPAHVDALLLKFNRNKDRWEQEYGKLDVWKVMELLQTSQEMAYLVLHYSEYGVASLDAKLRHQDGTLYDLIPAENIPWEGELFESEESLLLKEALQNLKRKSELRYQILSLYYGLDGTPPLALNKIAQRLEKSFKAVRYEFDKAHEYIKGYIEKNRYCS